jgi:hypothetical protein
MQFLEAKQFYKYCTDVEKPQDKRIVSDEEYPRIPQDSKFKNALRRCIGYCGGFTSGAYGRSKRAVLHI